MVKLIKDIPVYYEEYGIGKSILCIHGYLVDHRLMSGCFEPVFNQIQGYRRIYVDLPGMGKTPSAKWIHNAYNTLELLNEFIENIIPNENFLIAGESFGGHLALGLINYFYNRINGIMLLCPHINILLYKNGELPERKIIWKAEGIGTEEHDSDFKRFMEWAVIATPEIFDKYKNDILSGVSICDKRFLLRHFSGEFSLNLKRDLQNIQFDKPVCILTGRQDHVVGYSDAYELLEMFPRATFAVLDCTGHNLQIENEPLFNQFVKDWIWRTELSY